MASGAASIIASIAAMATGVRRVISRTRRPPATRAWASGAASSSLSMVRTGITGQTRIRASAVAGASLIPAMPVAFGQAEGARRAPGAGRIARGLHAEALPAVDDGVDEDPGRLRLVAADEQGLGGLDRPEKP